MINSYCPLPFNHLAIRPNGKVYPCCAFRWDDVPEDFNINDPDVFNHPFLVNIREKMLKNEPISGCSKCYENEEKTGTSTRKYFIKNSDEYGIEVATASKLVYLDLALSNTCNNKCRMCNAELSTSWYSDWKALGRKIPKGILEQNTVLENYDLSEIKFIKLIGGEPLMEQAKFIDILKRCDRKNLTILLTTNATLIPNEELTSLLKECKIFKVNLSIDATGPLNDFLRKGSKWEKTVEVIRWFTDNFTEKDSVNVYSVISIYNVNHIDKMYFFLKEHFPKVGLSLSMIDGPDWMHPKHLPEYAKEYIIKLIYDWKKIVNHPFFNKLESELSKGGDFRQFMRGDKELSDLRNEHWKDANPELYEMVKNFYD